MNTDALARRFPWSRPARLGAAVLVALAMLSVVPLPARAATGWSSAANLTTARRQHTATLLPSGKVLVMGGYGSSGVIAVPELYDPSANTWTGTGGLSSASARFLHTATLLGNGKALIAGGNTSGGSLATNTTRLYDPTTNTWSLGPNMAAARY